MAAVSQKLYTSTLTFTTTTGTFADQQLIELPIACCAWIEIDACARDVTGDLTWHVWKKYAGFSRTAAGGSVTSVGTVQTLVSQGTMTKPVITLGHDGVASMKITAHSGEVNTVAWSVAVRYQIIAS